MSPINTGCSPRSELHLSATAIRELLENFPPGRWREASFFRRLADEFFASPSAPLVSRKSLLASVGGKLKDGSAKATASTTIGKLKRILNLVPVTATGGIKWRIERKMDGKDAWFRLHATREPVISDILGGVPNGSPMHLRFLLGTKEFRAQVSKSPTPCANELFLETKDCFLAAHARPGMPLDLIMARARAPWTFPGGRHKHDAFERLSQKYWTKREPEERSAGNRIWDGRLWGVEEWMLGEGENAAQLTLVVNRVRYRSVYFLHKNWRRPTPTELYTGKAPRDGFAGLLRCGSITNSQTSPVVSPLRLGIVVFLRGSNEFVLTELKDKPISLAGRGMMFSLMTPESLASPRYKDQVNRRLVEDLGLAIDPRQVDCLGYARFAGADGAPCDHFLFAGVEVDLDRAEFEEIFDSRRYDQFVTKPRFLPIAEAPGSIQANPENYDAPLRLGLALFLLREGKAILRHSAG